MNLVKSTPWVVGTANKLVEYHAWEIGPTTDEVWCVVWIQTISGTVTVDLSTIIDSSCLFEVNWGDGTTDNNYRHTYTDTTAKMIQVRFAKWSTSFLMYDESWIQTVAFMDMDKFDKEIEIRDCSGLYMCNVESNMSLCPKFLIGKTAIEGNPRLKTFNGTGIHYGLNAKLSRLEVLVESAPNVTSLDSLFIGSCFAVASSDKFVGMPNVTSVSNMFAFNTTLWYVEDTLFTSNFPEANDFSYCFAGCEKLSSAPKLWEQFPNANGEGCYQGCTGLSWYNQIPSGWK